MTKNLIKKIEKSDVYKVAKKTPIHTLPLLSEKIENTLQIKREDLQNTFSFKIRGSYNKIANLPKSKQKLGIVAASAGNHAQGVALCAQKLKIIADIVMPKTTPDIKVNAVKRLGAKVHLIGDTFDEACAYAHTICEQKKATFIHPFDDLDIIAGQGTVGKEIISQCTPLPDYVFVAVGGGSLLAGTAAYIKHHHPKIKIIAVEEADSACLSKALKANKVVPLKHVGIFADGIAVKQIGKHNFNIIKPLIEDCITVNTDQICAAIKDTYDDTRSILEPAGAVSIAGAKKYCEKNKIKGKQLLAIACGANINFDRLRHISERAELGEEKEMIFAVKIPEKKGSFKAFCSLLGKRSITEFNYRFSSKKEAIIYVGIAIQDKRDKKHIFKTLTDHHYAFTDLTDNEMAKLHLRFMVGGHATIRNEKLFRCQFPERPGALMNFLESLGTTFNISLFHYRNHGAAFGRILLGVQVGDTKLETFKKILKDLNIHYTDENKNPGFALFLK